MATKTEQTTSAFDTLKLIASVLALAAGLGGFYIFEDESQLLRVLGMLGVVVLAFLIVATTDIGRRGLAFARDARVEVRKVVWPTRQEALQTTLAVLFMVILVAIMLWLFDLFLGWGISKILA